MLSLVRKCSTLRSSVSGIGGACCKNLSTCSETTRIYYRPIPQHKYPTRSIQTSKQQNFGTSVRIFSTLEGNPEPKATRLKISTAEITEFMAVYPDVVRDLTDIADSYKSAEAAVWFKKALEYNLSLTNAKHGLIAVLTYKSFLDGEAVTAENLRLAHILGWCLELLHCVVFLTDDIADNSTTRRGQVCWYKMQEAGSNAINDALMIENGIYELLSKHFRHLDLYVNLVDLLRQNTFKCLSGQSLDALVSKRNVKTFDMHTYKSIVRNKTSSNFFYLPVALGLRLAGVKDEKVFSECEEVTFELGNYCQVLNDYLDCFGNPATTGKIGTDISSNKCSWLAVACMELASPEQRAVMEECYGQNDPHKTARIEKLYEELNIPTIFAKYEEDTYIQLKRRICQISNGALHDVLLEILNHVNLRGVK